MTERQEVLRATALASDGERDAAVSVLSDAFAHGRLTSDEHLQRTTKALAARTHGELDEVLAGLQAPELDEVPAGLHAPAAGPSHSWRAVAFWVMTVLTSPFLAMGAILLLGGQDTGDRVAGIVMLVLFLPGLLALRRWAWPSEGRHHSA